jgi:hypothetical protein
MPLPLPKKSEKQGDFISRCAGNETMNKDFKDTKQRVAVCYSQWKKAKASASASVGDGDNEVLINFECEECVEAAQKTYSGKKRSELKDSDFLYPQERSFPIVSPVDVKDAVNSFGRSKGKNYEDFKRRLVRKVKSKGPEFVKALPQTIKDEFKITASAEEDLMEYKNEFLEMALGSIGSIKQHAENILNALDSNPVVKENLTEPFLQQQIALAEDYMITIHNYAMFAQETDEESEDTEDEMDTETEVEAEEINENNFHLPEESEYVSAEEVAFDANDVIEYDIAKERPGLWENIKRKKQREGKNYKPAKPGDKDRPSKEAWKKAQGAEYQGRKVQLNKPFRTSGGPKKFAVYTKNESGNVVIVRFGDPNMKIKKNIPERRKSFRARHNCDNPGPKWKARYWACKSW